MGTQLLPTRVQPDDECTRDPVFVLQRCRVHIRDEIPEYRWEYDNGVFVHEDSIYDDVEGIWGPVEDFPATCTILEAHIFWSGEYTYETWDTECAFFTRAEATDYVEAREYNYRAGWRVWSIPCNGDLRDILGGLTTYEDGEPYRKEDRVG